MQTVSVDQLVGKTLGDYQIDQLLGRGKMSAVYLAQQRSQNRRVMMTAFVIPESLSISAYKRFAARFEQIGSSLVQLHNPHILPIYDCGVKFGFPYLVTSFVKGGSLAQALKQQSRFTPELSLNMVKQIADGLDHAHSQGLVHGLLNPANILIIDEQILQITGFGLKQMLQMRGIEEYDHPQSHLFSIAGTFLGAPEYIAPECVLGSVFDARADVYALGVMLFELLSGSPPFIGKDPLEIASKRLQYPVPSLHETCPELPAAYDLIFYLALEREPEKRYKHAGELVIAFERVLRVLKGAAKDPATLHTQTSLQSQITLPPTVNWFDEEIIPTRKWQFLPPVVTGHMPAVQGSPQDRTDSPSANSMKQNPEQEQAEKLVISTEKPSLKDSQDLTEVTTDPFVWWSTTSAGMSAQAPGTFARGGPKRPTNYNANKLRKASVRERRQVVVGLLTGTAVVGILGIGGISFARFIESTKQLHVATSQATLPKSTTQSSPTKVTQPTPHPTPKPTQRPTPKPTQAPKPTPKPTQAPPKPTPTPPPPQHTGTVIGHTNMSTNSSANFANPADGQGSLLIRLSNGSFVACERACTHQGVPVNYDPGTQTLVCPAHGAVFDPANGFNHLQGPGNGPLKSVSIRMNADGTITTG